MIERHPESAPGFLPRLRIGSGLRRLLAVWLLLLIVRGADAEATFSFDTAPGQLPKTVVPHHYSLWLQPDLTNLVSHGTVAIEIEVRKPVKEIVLNALNLDVTKAVLAGARDLSLSVHTNAAKQVLILSATEEIAPGNYRLSLEFTGRITEQTQGLFYVKYTAPSGPKILIGTQMEPTDARRMFPCWDEPSFRATYEITVVVPEKHTPVSNLPAVDEKMVEGGLKEVHFARTPPMSSYLVVLVSGELEMLETRAEGVQLRVFATEGKKEQCKYALDSTKRLLNYYNKYFGIKYPLPKLDQIAVPGGFDGAMENWGGIVYNETFLLFDPKNSSQQTRQDIFVTIAHEMAHQWFGNLVTTAWWDNLWLNEGFASWMENKATDHFYPSWQMWLKASADKTGVMSADARSTTHAILHPVENESQANDAFDSIAYQKAQSVLRMLENYLGEEPFRNGIHDYLTAHKYSNTTSADLWSALAKTSGRPVESICSGWTEQPGFPLVKVTSSQIDGKRMVWLQQERFTIQYPDAAPLRWSIPVSFMDPEHPSEVRFSLLEGPSNSLTFPEDHGLIKVNAGDVGYYRVAYDDNLRQELFKNYDRLPPADRLNLIADAWAAVEANQASAVSYLELVSSMHEEKLVAIWDQILTTFEFLDELQRGRPGRVAFQRKACQLLRPQLYRLGWSPKSGEAAPNALLRGRILLVMGQFGDEPVISKCKSRFEAFLANPESLDADLRRAVISIAGRYADKTVAERIHELARQAKGTEDRQMYYQALAGALNDDLANSTLALALTSELVPQEATGLVIEVADLGEHPEQAWAFAQKHITELQEKLESFDRNTFVPNIMREFSDDHRAVELEAYATKNLPPEAMNKVVEAAATIRLKAGLKARELPRIDEWVKPTAK